MVASGLLAHPGIVSRLESCPGGSLVKNLPASAGATGDKSSIPGERNGNPLQYSCLEIPRTEEPSGLQSKEADMTEHEWVSEELLSLPAHSPSTAGTTEPQGCHWPTAGPATVENRELSKENCSRAFFHAHALSWTEVYWGHLVLGCLELESHGKLQLNQGVNLPKYVV